MITPIFLAKAAVTTTVTQILLIRTSTGRAATTKVHLPQIRCQIARMYIAAIVNMAQTNLRVILVLVSMIIQISTIFARTLNHQKAKKYTTAILTTNATIITKATKSKWKCVIQKET